MRYVALATDFDGTLAHDGRVEPATVDALKRLAASGRELLLVTGRELDDLRRVFDAIDIFDMLVVENGAVLHRPSTGATRVLGAPPPPDFVAELRRRGVTPLSVGASIVATWHPNEQTVLEVIRELGLELQVIFNKGAVMVLPAGTNKASGMAEALHELGLSAHNLAAIGDAENDHALLDMAECAVAVANAVPMLKSLSHLPVWVDPSHGIGVRKAVPAMMRAAIAVGADGLIVEVHPDPPRALSDGHQSLEFSEFEKAMDDVRAIAGALGRDVARLG